MGSDTLSEILSYAFAVQTAELEALSKDRELADRVALKVFENIKKGFDKILKAFPQIDFTYTISEEGRFIYSDPFLFRFYLGTEEKQFNHNFREYWHRIKPYCNSKAIQYNHLFLKLVVDPLKRNLDEFLSSSDFKYRLRLMNCTGIADKVKYHVNSLDVIFWKTVEVQPPGCFSRMTTKCFPQKTVSPTKDEVLNSILVKGSVEEKTANEDRLYNEYIYYTNGTNQIFRTRVVCNGVIDSFHNKKANIDDDVN